MTVRIPSLLSVLVVILCYATTITTTQAQSISVNKACIKSGEVFTVTFQNKNQVDSDWIGIIPASANTKSFNDIGIWVWTCGSQSCEGAVAFGRVNLRASNVATGSWRAVLARDQLTGPFSSYAQSTTFTIAASCPTSTVPSPVKPPVKPPLKPPVKPPVVAPTSSSGGSNTIALRHINDATNEIKSLINNDIKLAAQFLRLTFHDCIGGCDGTYNSRSLQIISCDIFSDQTVASVHKYMLIF
jgi:hypothetical protein